MVRREITEKVKNKNINNIDGQWSVFSLAMEMGWIIIIPIVLFALGGRILDKTLKTAPIFLLVGIFASILLTSWLVYRKMIAVIKEQEITNKE